MARLREIFQFFGRGMWRIRLHELSPARSFLLRVVRILVLSVREFQRDKCSLRASALTYYTLLAIVPVLAMAFGIAKGFGMEEKLETAIRSKLVWESDADVTGETAAMLGEGGTQALSGAKQGLAQVADYAIKFANNMLEGVKGGWVAGIGVLLLFWIIIKTLGNIEKSFNDIWGVRKSRSWPRKFSDYLAFMVISPVVFVMAGSLTGVVVARGAQLVERFAVWGWMDGAGLFALRILPMSLIWLLFAFTYLFMPNTKVRLRSGLLGGIVAGTLFQLTQVLYLRFQIGITRFNAIYGSFAALPFFLAWLQVSWLIMLYGAELAFADSHVETYEFEPDCLTVRRSLRVRLMVAIIRIVHGAFERAEPAVTSEYLCEKLGAPIRLVNDVVFELTEAGLLVEVAGDGSRSEAYQPGCDVGAMTVAEVLERIEDYGMDDLPLAESDELEETQRVVQDMRQARRAVDSNRRIRDL